MKKLLALFLALSMVVFSGVTAFASGIDYGAWGGASGDEPGDSFFALNGANSSAKHAEGKEFEIVLDVTDITLEEGGIQALEFKLSYDPALITPVTKAGEEGNFDAVISGIENWEGFGRLDETAGEYYIAFGGKSENAGEYNAIDGNASVRFTFKFMSTAAAVGSELVFNVKGIRGVDLAGNECSPADFGIKVADGNPKPVQPTEKGTLPEGAIALTHLGYVHDNNLSVIDYVKDSMTVGEYTARYCKGVQKDMNWFYLAILDKDLVVTAVYDKLGRSKEEGVTLGEKDKVIIPADSYVLAVNAGNEKNPDWATTVGVPFKEAVKVGAIVELYNVNIDGVIDNWNHTRVVELEQAGFTLRSFADVQPEQKEDLPEGAIRLTHAGYAHTNNVGVIGYVAEDSTIGDFTKRYYGKSKDMNYFYVAILDENLKVTAVYTTTGRSDVEGVILGEKTDVAIPAGSYVIGINKGDIDDWKNGPAAAFLADVKVGSQITLCNINEQGLKDLWIRQTTVELTNAGFTVSNDIPVQPAEDEMVTLPDDAFDLTDIGHWYQPDTSFFGYVNEDTTIGEYTLRFDKSTRDLNYFYVAILDENLKVIAVYDKLGRNADENGNTPGIKTNVVIPAGGYILGVHAGNGANWKSEIADPFHSVIKVGSEITLYNVNLDGVRAQYDKAENVILKNAGFTVYNEPAIQPEPLEDLPEGAKKIDYVGYKHEGGLTVLLPAKEATTIGALVRLGDAAGIGAEDPDMNYWAVMIIDDEGKVIGIYNKLGKPDGVKTDIAVPAGGAVIGTHGKADAFEGVNIGDTVRVYNLTEECFNVTGHKAVTKAGYTVTPAPAAELTPKADAQLEVINGKIRLYIDNVTIEAFKAMFDNEFTVLDSEGNEITEGLVKTGMKINFGDGYDIIVVGDVDQNGVVNAVDYLYAKRAYLGTFTLSDAQKDAADLGNSAMGNLILLKRHIIGTQYIRELLVK